MREGGVLERVFVKKQSHSGEKGIFWVGLSSLGSKNPDGILKSLLPGEGRSYKRGGESIQCLDILLPTALKTELGYCFYQGASMMKNKMN